MASEETRQPHAVVQFELEEARYELGWWKRRTKVLLGPTAFERLEREGIQALVARRQEQADSAVHSDGEPNTPA